jgi:hypothetical protein
MRGVSNSAVSFSHPEKKVLPGLARGVIVKNTIRMRSPLTASLKNRLQSQVGNKPKEHHSPTSIAPTPVVVGARGIAKGDPVEEVCRESCRVPDAPGGEPHPETSQIADVGKFPKFCKVSVVLVGEVIASPDPVVNVPQGTMS